MLIASVLYHLSLKIAHFAELNIQRYYHFILFAKKWHALQIIRKDEVFHGLLYFIMRCVNIAVSLFYACLTVKCSSTYDVTVGKSEHIGLAVSCL